MSNSTTQHGGNIIAVAAELGCPVEDLLDMSSNLMPLPMVTGLRETIMARLDEIAFLPETESQTLRDLFAAQHHRASNEVLVGNGTTDFIFAAPAMNGLKKAIIVTPTYNDYRLACGWAGLPVEDFPLSEADDFHLDLARLTDSLVGNELVFICNPNNPSGGLTSSEEIHAQIKAKPESLFLVDESYLQFTREVSLLDLEPLSNLLILTSHSKIYGIPGLRLGILTGAPERLAAISARNKPWGVNRIAQVAGEYLVSHGHDHVEAVLNYTEEHRPTFVAALNALPGVEVVNGVCNFILCRLTGSMRAGQLREAMLAHRIIIRDCENFTGLDDRYFRVSLKAPDGNARCLRALREILSKP